MVTSFALQNVRRENLRCTEVLPSGKRGAGIESANSPGVNSNLAHTRAAMPGDLSSGVSEEPSVSAALERVAIATQGIITKRIDLALLEGQEAVSRILRATALASVGIILASAGWFALIWSVLLVLETSREVRFGVFGLLNVMIAAVLIVLAIRGA